MDDKVDIKRETIEAISSYVFNFPMAESLFQSIETGLRKQSVHFSGGVSVWEVFKQSLDGAIRDIEEHPRGILFKRQIRYGLHRDTAAHPMTSDGKIILSDPEWGKCLEFIFSHMINRFKGELTELLGLQPCLELMETLKKQNRLPGNVQLYWGDAPRQTGKTTYLYALAEKINNEGKRIGLVVSFERAGYGNITIERTNRTLIQNIYEASEFEPCSIFEILLILKICAILFNLFPVLGLQMQANELSLNCRIGEPLHAVEKMTL